MKKILRNWKVFLMPCLALVATLGFVHHTGIGIRKVSATNTPQSLPFSQNWSNAGLITANDDWSGVPGIVGFLGNYDTVNAPTNIDPRGLLTPFVTNDVDVIANQATVSLTNGGVAEFDGIANPVVALNGSGTADAPSIVIYVNTTGLGNIQFSCNIRDIDDTTDNSSQQVDVQYRVGGAGDYASVPGGYIADASSGPSTTMTTPLNLTLPAAANNQSQVEIRVITTNAGGNDEWVGADDISVTGTPGFVPADAPLDFNGDGKTDFALYRNAGLPDPNLFQQTWFWSLNGSGGATQQMNWGLAGDKFVMEDFDGDGKDDITAWRGAGTTPAFFILQSGSNTIRVDGFGLNGDDATVVGDYDGDGKADVAVYRPGLTAGAQSTWFYRGSLTPGVINYVPWGVNGDKVAPGDYNGDGKNDFVIRRGEGVWWQRLSTGAIVVQYFGISSDKIVPGDYDGDGKTDLTALRADITLSWFYLPSSGGGFVQIVFGNEGGFTVQGDYDGDGKTDPATFQPTNPGKFLVRNSSNGSYTPFTFGGGSDGAVGGFNTH